MVSCCFVQGVPPCQTVPKLWFLWLHLDRNQLADQNRDRMMGGIEHEQPFNDSDRATKRPRLAVTSPELDDCDQHHLLAQNDAHHCAPEPSPSLPSHSPAPRDLSPSISVQNGPPPNPHFDLRFTLKGHKKAISSVKFSPDGRYIASACELMFPHSLST